MSFTTVLVLLPALDSGRLPVSTSFASSLTLMALSGAPGTASMCSLSSSACRSSSVRLAFRKRSACQQMEVTCEWRQNYDRHGN